MWLPWFLICIHHERHWHQPQHRHRTPGYPTWCGREKFRLSSTSRKFQTNCSRPKPRTHPSAGNGQWPCLSHPGQKCGKLWFHRRRIFPQWSSNSPPRQYMRGLRRARCLNRVGPWRPEVRASLFCSTRGPESGCRTFETLERSDDPELFSSYFSTYCHISNLFQ